MRKVLLVFLICLGLAASAWAGKFGMNLGLGLYKPGEEGSSYTPMFRLGAHYWVDKHWVPTLEVGYARYSIADTTYSYLPVIPGVTYHFVLTRSFDPYVGAGVVYARKWWSGALEGDDDSWGFAALTGFDLTLSKKFGFGLGVEYVVPDAGDFDSAYPGFRFSLAAGGL
jgi:outer membrane protein W